MSWKRIDSGRKHPGKTRRWTNNIEMEPEGDVITLLDVSSSEIHDFNFVVKFNGELKGKFVAFCEAMEFVVKEYELIPKRSAWVHEGTGDRFLVKEPHANELLEEHAWCPDDDSEPYAYCKAFDYDEKEAVWLARRIFFSQMKMLDPEL